MTDNGDATYWSDRGQEMGLEAAWEAINQLIKDGDLGELANSERNGLVLAANAVRQLIDAHIAQ